MKWSENSTGPGQGIGNDARCGESTEEKCTTLKNEGTDCRWDVPTGTSALHWSERENQYCKLDNINMAFHPDQCFKHPDRKGWLSKYTTNSNALCLNEKDCKDLCASRSDCFAADVHKEKERCYLNFACSSVVQYSGYTSFVKADWQGDEQADANTSQQS